MQKKEKEKRKVLCAWKAERNVFSCRAGDGKADLRNGNILALGHSGKKAGSQQFFLVSHFCQKLQLNPRDHISRFGSNVLNGNAFCSTPGIHWIPFISTQHESLETWLAYVNTESTSFLRWHIFIFLKSSFISIIMRCGLHLKRRSATRQKCLTQMWFLLWQNKKSADPHISHQLMDDSSTRMVFGMWANVCEGETPEDKKRNLKTHCDAPPWETRR